MGVNRGKDFEGKIREGFSNVSGCIIDRIPDQMNGFAGAANICDFIVYKYPILLYLECKSCYGNTLNFHNITDKQWAGLLKKSNTRGVKAGVIIWFIDHDVTMYVPIQYLQYLKQFNHKSIRFDDENVFGIAGKKKRVFFEYNFVPLLNTLIKEEM